MLGYPFSHLWRQEEGSLLKNLKLDDRQGRGATCNVLGSALRGPESSLKKTARDGPILAAICVKFFFGSGVLARVTVV